MWFVLSSVSQAAPSGPEIQAALARAIEDQEVCDAFRDAVLPQAEARPLGAFGGTLVYVVDLSAALRDPTVDRAVSAELDLDPNFDFAGQVGLLLLPPQDLREVGAYVDDALIELAEQTELDQRTDDFGASLGAAIVYGGAAILWGFAAEIVYDTIYPPPPPPVEPEKAADNPQPIGPDTTPRGCKSVTDCDGDGLTNFEDPDDDNDGIDDLAPDPFPYDNPDSICDLCGGTPYPQGAFSFFVGVELARVAEELTVGFLLDTAGSRPVSLGPLGGGSIELYTGGR